MDGLLTAAPEVLNAHRTLAREWLVKAVDALSTFSDPTTGSFARDSERPDRGRTLTTPLRSYFALACASRYLPRDLTAVVEKQPNLSPQLVEWWRDWTKMYAEYQRQYPLEFGDSSIKKSVGASANNFEIARIGDCFFLEVYLRRFYPQPDASAPSSLMGQGKRLADTLKEHLRDSINREDKVDRYHAFGQVLIDSDDIDSRHFFFTLHTMRALDILERPADEELNLAVAQAAKQFCIEQCFFSHRRMHHKVDPARLTFAIVIYSTYGREVDREVIVATLLALKSIQSERGNWPATHPIIRESSPQNKENPKEPWFIATHELALSLTWMYFQPSVPDEARCILLDMMNAYFLKWLIPTYRACTVKEMHASTVKEVQYRGWYDDRATGKEMVVGWVSAIVCHFLSNFHDILSDLTNRRVIEDLGLSLVAQNFLIDINLPDRNPRFLEKDSHGRLLPVWSDLPPFAWPCKNIEAEHLGRTIAWNWSDPEEGNQISMALGQRVLRPICASAEVTVGRDAAGILDGPPGTRKTSLVETIASILKWPYIPVPASVFFDRGFDMLESRATEVFTKLNYLSSCVIFFDEFEEFFRDRGEDKAPASVLTSPDVIHDRTIAAFTTSAMLPRLQKLRERGKCLVFLATNHLDKIDSAIVRPGRFDFRITVEHPTISRFLSTREYFENPGRRMLSSLRVDADEQHMRPPDGPMGTGLLRAIAEPVVEALKSPPVEKLLREFNVYGGNGDAVLLASELRIRFAFVEQAMREVARNLEAPAGRDLREDAIGALVSAIRPYAAPSKDAAVTKGPPRLVEKGA